MKVKADDFGGFSLAPDVTSSLLLFISDFEVVGGSASSGSLHGTAPGESISKAGEKI